jgi:hypothetical protein
MVDLPKYTPRDRQERIGVNKVALMISELGYIFRETASSDVGIDGSIEYVNDKEEATGKIIAVQVKSGDSYLYENKTNKGTWTFYPEEKHKKYWEQFPIPVFLLVYRPADNNVYFIDVRYYFKTKGLENVIIPKNSILNESTKIKLFEDASQESFMNIPDVCKTMITHNIKFDSFSLSYLDLFIMGLTNGCRQTFFDMSVLMNIIELNACVSIGGREYDFSYAYINFLISQNLSEVNFEDCKIDWIEHKLVPRFIAPLTIRGKELLGYIQQIESNYPSVMSKISIVQDNLIQLAFDEYSYIRIQKINQMKNVIINNL